MTHMARTTDPETSHEAAATAVAGVRKNVLYIIKQLGVVTDAQIEQAYQSYAHAFDWTKASPARLRTARHELVEQGSVVFAETFDTTRYGRKTRRWTLAK